jgi:hypothetical protein
MDRPAEIARIEADIGFQRRFWQVQRVGWLGMLAMVVAALAGAFGGGGLLAEGTLRQAGVEITWPRIQRLGRAAEIRADGAPGALRLDPAAATGWRLRDASPPDPGAGPRALRIEPTGPPGPRRLHVRVGDAAFDLPVFVWP